MPDGDGSQPEEAESNPPEDGPDAEPAPSDGGSDPTDESSAPEPSDPGASEPDEVHDDPASASGPLSGDAPDSEGPDPTDRAAGSSAARDGSDPGDPDGPGEHGEHPEGSDPPHEPSDPVDPAGPVDPGESDDSGDADDPDDLDDIFTPIDRDGDRDDDSDGEGPSEEEIRRAEAEAAEALAAAREAEELARAEAERYLAGPALTLVEPRPSPIDLERRWNPMARASLALLRADLDDRRLGLVISGGGALGSFEAGALRFLYDHLRISPVALCGNSAGALNAAKLAEGDQPDRPVIDEVERVWRSLRINPDMWRPEPWLVRLQASATWASTLRSSGENGAAGTVRVALKIVGGIIRRPPETDGTIDAMRDALRAQSLLSLRPIAELVERELDTERVATSGIALRMGTVSLEAGELRYVTETGALHDRNDRPLDLEPVSLVDGILASASIPVAFPPVLMGDEHYVDGGAREILPLELMVEHLGVDRIIAISASSLDIDRAPSFADRNLLDILRRVSAEIAPNETLRKELNPPGGWKSGVRLVVPEFDVHDAMTIDPALIAISIDHGWLRAADQLLGLDDELAALTTKITRTRMALRRLAGPPPGLFDHGFGAGEVPNPAAESPESAHVLVERLRDQVTERRDRGGPLPAALLAWLDAPPDHDLEFNLVGGAWAEDLNEDPPED